MLVFHGDGGRWREMGRTRWRQGGEEQGGGAGGGGGQGGVQQGVGGGHTGQHGRWRWSRGGLKG